MTRWRAATVLIAICVYLAAAAGSSGPAAAFSSSADALLLEGTIVTMNASRDILREGRVLVRNGRIEAVWQGSRTPPGVDLTGVTRVALGPNAHIYPGLINLHDHPTYGVLPLWQPPASHAQPALGRPAGTEPYANRYQWNQLAPASIEHRRLVENPQTIFVVDQALNQHPSVVKFSEVRMVLGGTTATLGASPSAAYDTLLARNVESVNFGRQRILGRVRAIGALSADDVIALSGGMSSGLLDAWVVHLAEGVRDGDRPPGDPTSSRAEFADLKSKGLLNDTTVIVHGVALEAADFEEMAAAPAARTDGAGDGRGAKLVWSPLSNLLLYGRTTAVQDALAAGVLVSLGTDWAPSGSANLLTELKIADLVLRQDGAPGSSARGRSAAAIDQLLVEMVTINPAQAVRWDDQLGSIEAGKVADLLVIDGPRAPATRQVPRSPYRRLIDATEADVRLVIVGGVAVAGDVDVMEHLRPGDFEIASSAAGCFEKAIDVTDPEAPGGATSLAAIVAQVTDGLHALGGDFPPPGGGPSSPFANTWSYLKARFAGTAGLPDIVFNFGLGQNFGFTSAGEVNLEAIGPPPLFTADDEWWFATLGAARDEAGLTLVATPRYRRYPANANHVTPSGNPFAPGMLRERWYAAPECRAGR